MDCYTIYNSSLLGRLTLASDGRELTGLWLEEQKYFGAHLSPEAREERADPVLQLAVNWLDRYFAGTSPEPKELPLAPRGTDFQKQVWRCLCRIPYGQTVTYGFIARQLGSSARAVGSAVGRNPISIIIPCHRVLGSGGSLTGYAGGIERKRRLLELEGILPEAEKGGVSRGDRK